MHSFVSAQMMGAQQAIRGTKKSNCYVDSDFFLLFVTIYVGLSFFSQKCISNLFLKILGNVNT
jgi:hypothetical protein